MFVDRVAPDLGNLEQLFWGGDDAGCLSDSAAARLSLLEGVLKLFQLPARQGGGGEQRRMLK